MNRFGYEREQLLHKLCDSKRKVWLWARNILDFVPTWCKWIIQFIKCSFYKNIFFTTGNKWLLISSSYFLVHQKIFKSLTLAPGKNKWTNIFINCITTNFNQPVKHEFLQLSNVHSWRLVKRPNRLFSK